MSQAFAITARILAWTLALALVTLPVVAVLNGWIGAERWPLRVLRINDGLEQVDVARVRETVLPHAQRGFFAIDLAQAQVDRRWEEYEELALRGADRFAADPRRD